MLRLMACRGRVVRRVSVPSIRLPARTCHVCVIVRRADATSVQAEDLEALVKFQSSSAPKGGRNLFFRTADGSKLEFQSSSAPKGGRNLPAPRRRRRVGSFNPRPPRRADATNRLGRGPSAFNCFNPRPPRRADATLTMYCLSVLNTLFQSSSAPKGGRNIYYGNDGAADQQFQSSSAPKGGRNYLYFAPFEPETLFQSSSAPKGGRNAEVHLITYRVMSFNPRPPRRADATTESAWRLSRAACFNPRPPRRADATTGLNL